MSPSITENKSVCKSGNLAACPEGISGTYAGGMVDWKKLTIIERLKVLRKAKGLTQAEFAAEIGSDPETDAYGKAERTGAIGQIADKIHRRWPEIDAGWLFHGLTGNVPQAMENALDKAAEDLGIGTLPSGTKSELSKIRRKA